MAHFSNIYCTVGDPRELSGGLPVASSDQIVEHIYAKVGAIATDEMLHQVDLSYRISDEETSDEKEEEGDLNVWSNGTEDALEGGFNAFLARSGFRDFL